MAEVDAGDGLRGRHRRKDLPGRRLRAPEVDRRAAPVVERPEGIPGHEAAGAEIEGRLLPPSHMSWLAFPVKLT